MSADFLALSTERRLSSIVALNGVSTLAQISQYGLGTALLPIALEAHGASPESIGVTSAAFWLGMLLGLLVAGQLTRWLGYRNTVIAGLVISAISFVLIPTIDFYWWSLPATAIGFGLGLRWIANETWLYRLSPAEARGRIVGIHETLIGAASVAGPLLIVALGAIKPDVFWIAAAIMMLAIPLLFIAVTLPTVDDAAINQHARTKPRGMISTIGIGVTFGALIAGLGGWIEGSILALLPVYSADVGLSSSNTAWLLTILGAGAMVCQFPLGWLADRKGVIWSAKLCTTFVTLAIIISLAFSGNFYALAITTFVIGGSTAGLLTLGIIWATLHSTGAALTSRLRQVSIVYTCLSASGPFAAGFIVSHTSSTSLFWQQFFIVLVLIIVLIIESKKKNIGT